MHRWHFALFFATLVGCTSDNTTDGTLTAPITDGFSLAGVSETVLVGDGAGSYAVVHLGESTSVQPVAGALPSYPVAGRSFAGRFWALAADGSFASIDAVNATLGPVAHVALSTPHDILVETADSIWISGEGCVVRVSEAGAVLDTLTIDGAATGMTRVGNRLFVQIARTDAAQHEAAGAVAVIDLPTRAIVKVLDLVPKGVPGRAPEGPMIVDEAHHKLLLTALGARPSDTGMVTRIDLESLELDPWFFRSGSGFQGGLAFGNASDELYIAYHTSTPVASTHLFRYRIADDGELVDIHPGALLDAFEVVDVYPMNASRTLLALPVTCPIGFCLGGKGITFVSTKSGEVHPRLPATTLGLDPDLVVFL